MLHMCETGLLHYVSHVLHVTLLYILHCHTYYTVIHVTLRYMLHCDTCYTVGHEGFVGLSVCKVHISATRWRIFTLTAVALRLCRAPK
jgi:hypothetical protein